ncbi:hypothetical protein [Salana multivorans]
MTAPLPSPDLSTLTELVPAAIELAREWAAAASVPTSRNDPSARLGALLADPAGLDLAVAFVDRVARPEDAQVAAREAGGPARSRGGRLPRPDRPRPARGGPAGGGAGSRRRRPRGPGPAAPARRPPRRRRRRPRARRAPGQGARGRVPAQHQPAR